jgi:hypothetical protein
MDLICIKIEENIKNINLIFFKIKNIKKKTVINSLPNNLEREFEGK